MEEVIPEASVPEAIPVEGGETAPATGAGGAVEAGTEGEAAPKAPEELMAQMGRNEPLAPEPEPLNPPSQTAGSASSGVLHAVRTVLLKARDTIQFRKRKRLEKILTTLEKKNRITNDEVEKLLRVSDATATRYLATLEKEGKIRQVGAKGPGVGYEKI